MTRALVAALVLASLSGCSGSEDRPSTLTSGSTFVLVTESHFPLLQQGAAEFQRVYPDVRVDLAGTSTREAIVHLLNDSVWTVCVDRELNKEEQEVAASAGKVISSTRVAQDALAVIVHEYNPLQEVSFASLRKIVSGTATNWKDVPEARWSGSIELVLTGRNSGPYELLQEKFFRLDEPIRPPVIADHQRGALEYVASHPQAVTFVSLSALRPKPGRIRVVAVEATTVNGEEPYVRPSQRDVYVASYPLSYGVYILNTEPRAAVGVGFSSFMLTVSGQKLVQEAGLVPAVIPNRIIQLNTE